MSTSLTFMVGLLTVSLFVAGYGVVTAMAEIARARKPGLLRGAKAPGGRPISSGTLLGEARRE